MAVLSVCLLGCATVDCCATGMSYISDMSVPAPRNRVIGDWGYSLDISRPRKLIGGAGCRFVAPGIAMYPDTHGEYIWEVFASVDLPSFGRATWAELADTPGIFPILSPLIGAWFWVESPDNAGFLLGVKAGLGARLRGPPRAPARHRAVRLHGSLWRPGRRERRDADGDVCRALAPLMGRGGSGNSCGWLVEAARESARAGVGRCRGSRGPGGPPRPRGREGRGRERCIV